MELWNSLQVSHPLGLWDSQVIETMSGRLHRRAPSQSQQIGSVALIQELGPWFLTVSREQHICCNVMTNLRIPLWKAPPELQEKQKVSLLWSVPKEEILTLYNLFGRQMPVHHLGSFRLLWPNLPTYRRAGHSNRNGLNGRNVRGAERFAAERLSAPLTLSQLLLQYQSLPLQRRHEGQWHPWGICGGMVEQRRTKMPSVCACLCNQSGF